MFEFLDNLVCIPSLWSVEKIDKIYDEYIKELAIWNVMIEFYHPKTVGNELPDLTRNDFKKIRLGLKSLSLDIINDNDHRETSIINIEHIDIHYFTEWITLDQLYGDGMGGKPRCEITINILSKSPTYYNQLKQSYYGCEKLDLLKTNISIKIQERLNKLSPPGFEMIIKEVYNPLRCVRI
uniref:Uncharacterized protein n=1 Tax=Florenciella sp. virus SA2 TaxID=3240092 RepID=A0AB39JEV2_9VIRU